METILGVAQVLVAIAMTAIILVQRGAGAAAGSGFGAGASATVFGSRGSGSFLTRTTAILAVAFFGISLVMAVLASRMDYQAQEDDLGVMADVVAPSAEVSDVPEVPVMNAVESDEVPVLPLIDGAAEETADPEAVEESQGEGEG